MKRILIILFFLINVNTIANSSGPYLPDVKRGIEGKIPGDIIAVKTDKEIMAWCDFNKQIIVNAQYTLCVYRR